MKQRKQKQIAAIVGIVVLVLTYILALIAAILDKSASGKWFLICIVATLVVPVFIWVYIWLFGKISGKDTIADLHLMEDQDEKNE